MVKIVSFLTKPETLVWFGRFEFQIKNELVAKKPLCYVTWLKIHIWTWIRM